ncbi:MAG: glycosyl hydrolase [Gemmatimonadota bacterium]|nr:glycosyl hydrolase [Gemmatimonadota bacterium]
MRVLTRRAAITLLVALPVTLNAQRHRPPRAEHFDSTLYKEIGYRFIGPDGNRVIAVAGVPGDHRVYYAGAASGGLWKSTDAGTHWIPLTDSLPVSSIGSIAIAPSDHNVIYIGTGETFIRSNISIGDGVWKSIDAGKTWKHVGLDATGRIGRMLVDPRDANIVLAAALGTGYAPQTERGVYRSRDGGATWEKVLFVNDSTGVSDLAMDPSNPNILFAGTWQIALHPWSVESGGAGSGIYASRDGGTTWKRVQAEGLPKAPMGKIAVQVARSDPNRIYALIETKDPGLYRSDDGGRRWRLVNQDHDFLERPHYYTRFAIAPDDENRLYFVSVRFTQSLDGGLSKLTPSPRAGGDLHDIWIDPLDSDRIMVGDDAGVSISVDRGRNWMRVVLPNAQMYHVAADNAVPYYVYGNRQDGYSYRGPSNSREAGRSLGNWEAVGGCESGFALPDTVDGRTVWSGCYDGGLERFDLTTRMARAVKVWPEAGYGITPRDLKERFNWTFPIAISPHDHAVVYVGSQHLWRTGNGGQSWSRISPDLTTNDSTKQRSSGGIVPDNLFVENATALSAIAESPVSKGVIWVGTADGLVQVTRDGGAHWENVTAAIPRLPRWGWVSNIEPSRREAGRAYLAVDLHQMNDRNPYIFETTDFGRSWRSVAGDLPRSPFSNVHVIREDSRRAGMLYAGTENGVWYTLDDGAHWMPLQNNLPRAPVSWLTIQPHFDDLVVATYGRGIWILDDVAPFRIVDDSLLGKKAMMFPAREAYRFRRISNTVSAANSLVSGENPPAGGDVTYFVRDSIAPRAAGVPAPDSAAKMDAARQQSEATRAAPADTMRSVRDTAQARDSLELAVLDSTGTAVRRFKAPPPKRGLNRAWWDLHLDGPRPARLRTAPPEHAHARPGGGSRALVTWDLDIAPGLVGPLAAPGRYTVRAIIRTDTISTPMLVRRDPNSTGSDADIAAQLAMSLELRDQMNAVVDMIDQLEWMRKQLVDLGFLESERKKDVKERHAATEGTDTLAVDSLVKVIKSLEKRALDVERKLFDVNLSGAREDAFRSPVQLFEKLASLATEVGSSSADSPPTDQQREVRAMLAGQLKEARARFDALLREEIPAFNRSMGERGVPGIVVRAP